MKTRITVALLALALAMNTEAGGRRRVTAVSPTSPALSVVFVDGELLDAGTIASNGRKKKSTTTTRNVTLRIGAASRESRGTATLRAFLEVPDPRCTIRIDGIVLGAAPRVIQRHAPIGIAVTHRIEIEVPHSAAEGPLQTAIGWEITTE